LYSGGIYFTRSDYASGATGKSEVELSYVAWGGNKASTAPVQVGRMPNKLNIYDMSGNVMEWLEDWVPLSVDSRQILPSYYSLSLEYTALIGAYNPRVPASMETYIGFRIARSR
jgi:formylglycine-generating enzyme required for sulfatase activity